jgi:heme A synthase
VEHLVLERAEEGLMSFVAHSLARVLLDAARQLVVRVRLARYMSFLIGLTFCLLLAGGLVHNTRSSLACPDWPLCFGSAFPKMEGGVLVEHGHRLLATTVGFGTFVLFIALWFRARRTGERSLAWLGAGALGLVIAQGVLGGLTVIYRLPTLVSTGHLATSMVFFSLLIYIRFRLQPTSLRPRASLGAPLVRASGIVAVVVYVQMLMGALMRHLGAGLACTDLPFCKDGVWPAGAHPNVLLHAAHRLTGVFVFVVTAWLAVVALRTTKNRLARTLACAAPLLTLVQATLGWLSISSFLDVVPVTAHLGVAAMLLADLVSLHLYARGARRSAAFEAVSISQSMPSVGARRVAA